eukprot:TRINITY_DN109646_c0_g1_i1.p1 TRINITY_DN109646_c0_g1~~TRINITY_DN109646_c0_g1_i1.p1  ORF type:complete len:577 (-),score=130.35 TRINITY_DN109646_c0_g1_i1:16-1713(-)
MSAGLLLWLLSRDDQAYVLQIVAKFVPSMSDSSSSRASTPAQRAVGCALSSALLTDPARLSKKLESWGHAVPPPPLWTPASTLSSSCLGIHEPVEVCCQGGWLQGTVCRPPLSEPFEARDECWVVACSSNSSSGNQSDSARVYSRHVWAPGWRAEAAAANERLRLALLAHLVTTAQLWRSGAALYQRFRTGHSELRRSLLGAVVGKGLAPKALAPAPTPPGPVLRGAQGIPLHCGDKVWLGVSLERAKQLQQPRYGDWSQNMPCCLDFPGRIVETLQNPPRVRVCHGSIGTFLWNPAAITRAESTSEPMPFEETNGPLVVGDEVLLCSDQERAVPLQVGHGGWSARMAGCLGRFGRLKGFTTRSDLRVDTPGCGVFLWNPAAVELPGCGPAAALCLRAVSRFDDEGAAALLLLGLNELCDAADGDLEAIQDVLTQLQQSSADEKAEAGLPQVHPGLRPYGALALLAVALDLRKVIQDVDSGSKSTLKSLPKVYLPKYAPQKVLAALAESCAMAWSAEDTGGISFASVVAGDVDAMVAANRWILAFFATRHRRILQQPPSLLLSVN